MREAVDQAIGNSVAKKLGVLIAAIGDKWQHSDRIDGDGVTRSLVVIDGCRHHERNNKENGSGDGSLPTPPFPMRHTDDSDNSSRFSRFRVPLQPLQIGANVGSVLVTQISILPQRLLDDLFQLQRYFS